MKRRPEICLSLNCRTVEEIKADIDEYGQYCQAVEWCGDRLTGIAGYSDEEFVQILKLIKAMCGEKRFIFDYKGEEQEMNRFLRLAMGAADYIDIGWGNSETKQLMKEAKKKRTKVLLSFHEMERILTKEDISTQLLKMEQTAADVLEVVAFANREEDAYALLEGAYAYNQLKRHKPFVAIAMGDEGQASRICCGDFGSIMSYACGSKPTAPGQFNARDLARYMDTYYSRTEVDKA